MNNSQGIIYSIAAWFLAGYIFFGTFLTGVTGIPYYKAFFAIGALVFLTLYFIVGYRNCKHLKYFWLTFPIVFIYAFVLHKTTLLSHFYVSIFGLFYVIDKHTTFKILKFVFVFQFILVFYEFLTQSLVYTNVAAGLFSVTDVEQSVELFEHSGFRTKGLFMGTLEAASFCIGCSLISSKSFYSSLMCLLMAIMINGRMCLLICFVIFIYNVYLQARRKHIPDAMIKLAFIFVGALLVTYISYKATTSVRYGHLLDVVNFESADNAGRILSYTQGWAVYTQNYSLIDKLTGGEYELLDIYGRPTLSAESELTGTLLDVGLIGLIWILSPVIICLKRKSKLFSGECISGRLLTLLSLICMIQYRHVSGNVRGVLFWLLMFLIMEGYYDYTLNNQSAQKK